MAYVTKKQRNTIDLFAIGDCKFKDSRELGYAILTLAETFLRDHPTSYNDVVGAVETVKHEIYKKYILPFEEQNKFDNGDTK